MSDQKPDLKNIGKGLAEDLVKKVISEVVKPYAQYYILKSDTKVDDILLPFLDDLEKGLLQLADKIDGEDDAAE